MYEIPFADGTLRFDVPAGMRADVVTSRRAAPLEAWRAIRDALSQPVGAPPLADLARPGDRVCIAVTDATRACPDQLLVPPLVTSLELAGVAKEDITILVAVGLHRPSTSAEKEEKLGTDIVQRYKVLDHDARDPAWLTDLGAGPLGCPLVVSRRAYEADLIIATGVVEPHQYAGYSGGAKTLAIGCAGEATIAFTHGPRMLDDPGVRLARIDGNPFQAIVREAGRRAGLRFAINVVLDEDYRIVAVAAGDPDTVHDTLVAEAAGYYTAPIGRQYDAAVAGVGWPKDVNLYQASRAASYLYFAPTPVVREGGFLIVPAPLPEGPGQGEGERRFYDALARAPDPAAVIADAHANGYPPGGQRAYIMAQVLQHCTVVVVGARDPEVVQRAHMTAVPAMDDALALVAARFGPAADVLIVPHALQTLPVVSRQSPVAS
ncbi:MAG TPA: nickel-dependent lactate racemase [Thermomicrobiales bacterium]|nr:nickel-dependent lactate racemase [Thermomicrobiales bacterium]